MPHCCCGVTLPTRSPRPPAAGRRQPIPRSPHKNAPRPASRTRPRPGPAQGHNGSRADPAGQAPVPELPAAPAAQNPQGPERRGRAGQAGPRTAREAKMTWQARLPPKITKCGNLMITARSCLLPYHHDRGVSGQSPPGQSTTNRLRKDRGVHRPIGHAAGTLKVQRR